MTHIRTNQKSSLTRLPWTTTSVLLLMVGSWACSDTNNPNLDVVRAPSDVNVIRLDSSAPALESDSVSFYAIEGQNSSAELYFDSAGTRIDRLLRFEVDKSSLDRLPSGQKIHHGDSVLITIRVTDRGSLQFGFSPSGLVFKRSDPPILTIGYRRALTAVTAPAAIFRDQGNRSGGGGSRHGEESTLAIWLQENPSSPFVRLESDVDTQAQEIEAEIPGFSRYAVAY